MKNIFIDNLKIDKRSNYPIASQLVYSIKMILTDQGVNYLDVLPSIQEVSSHLSIRKSDVLEAYDHLIAERYVIKQDDDYVVSYLHLSGEFYLKVIKIYDAIAQMGLKPSFKNILLKKTKLPLDLKAYINHSSKESYFNIKRVFYGNDIPLLVTDAYLPFSKFPEIDKNFSVDHTIYDELQKLYDIKVHKIKKLFTVVNLDKTNSTLLNLAHDVASYQTISIAYDQNHEFVEISKSWATFNYFFELNYNKEELQLIFDRHLFFI